MLMFIIQLPRNQLKLKTNSKYLVEYLDEAIRPLVLIMPKRNGYAKAFKIKEGHKDKDSELTLSVQIMRSYQKSIKLFGLRVKT